MRIARNISAVDTHVCGEPGRVIVGGVLDVPGNTIFEKKCYLEEHGDHLRKMMLREPRGYPASNCNLILPACHPKVDIDSSYPAVVPTISGRAWITGTANYMLDPDDPFPEGFTVSDIWGGEL